MEPDGIVLLLLLLIKIIIIIITSFIQVSQLRRFILIFNNDLWWGELEKMGPLHKDTQSAVELNRESAVEPGESNPQPCCEAAVLTIIALDKH